MKKLIALCISIVLFNWQIQGAQVANSSQFLTPKQGVSPSMTEIFCVATENIPNLGTRNSTLLKGQVLPETQHLLAQLVPGQVVNGIQVVEYSNGLTPAQICRNIHPNLEVQFVGIEPLAQLPNVTITQTGQIRR